MASIVIASMGARGDGFAPTGDGIVGVPYTLPGETVAVEAAPGEWQARLLAVERESPERVAPICPHFGACGGCKLQHWAPAPYLAWKRSLVAEALHAQGIEAPVAAAIDAHGAGRRRATFHARREGRETRTGFMRARSHDIIAIDACPVLAPAMARAPSVAAEVGELLTGSGKPLDIAVTATDAGLDVTTRGHGPLSPAARRALVALANRHDLARLSNHGEVVLQRRPPLVAIGDCRLVLPPGAFLQATAAGEATLASLVETGLGQAGLRKGRRIADLFCGVGPFALRLAATRQVAAFDSDAAAVAALMGAARNAQGLKPVEVRARDLFRRPLLAPELKAFDAVLLDPPRQGALAQARELARSSVNRVVYVSCDPSSFARDAATLVAGAFTLVGVTPVDQFRYSAHVELVGLFVRR